MMITKEEFVKSFQGLLVGELSSKDFAKIVIEYMKSPDYNRWKAAQAVEDLKRWKAGRARLLELIDDARKRGFPIETEILALDKGHDSMKVSLGKGAICFPSFFPADFVDLNWTHVEAMMTQSKRACGHADCSTSTSIDDVTLTFGRGSLHEMGYWEIPCAICAEAYQKDHPNQPVWPKKKV